MLLIQQSANKTYKNIPNTSKMSTLIHNLAKQISNLVCTTCFWNNLHQVRSKSVDTIPNTFQLCFRRNDIISNVREAALVALNNIGGEKANEAIRVTQVLEKEIRSMKSTQCMSISCDIACYYILFSIILLFIDPCVQLNVWYTCGIESIYCRTLYMYFFIIKILLPFMFYCCIKEVTF